ncbi:MAG: hypothetical protein AAGI01_06780 [Myxococcota bacterium]
MHPWFTYIHPSLRTSLVVWGITRAGFLGICARHSEGSTLTFPDSIAGAPLWSALLHLIDAAAHATSDTVLGLPTRALALRIVAEVLLWAAIHGVYSLCRKDMLPQTAERATWLWATSPVLLLVSTHDPGPWALAIPCAAIALGAACRAQFVLGSLAMVCAVFAKPECVLLAPGLAWLGWRDYAEGRDPGWAPWAMTLAPIAALPAAVFTAFFFGGRAGISLRTLSDTPWRRELVWHGPWAHLPDLGALLVVGLAVACAGAYFKRVPRAWWALVAPAVLWPFTQAAPEDAMALYAASVPLFAVAAKVLDDPTRERPFLVLSVLMSALLI